MVDVPPVAAPPRDGYLPVAEAARLLGVNRVTVWRWIAAGRLPVWRAGPRTARIKRADLDQLLVLGQHNRNSRAAAEGEHVVHFYESDDYLAATAAGYLGAALAEGGVAIAIGTAAHQCAIDARLAAAGHDLAALRLAGRYVPLDAAETLARFMVDGSPDPARFAESIGALVERACESGGTVRGFGEMVALLALDGNPEAAVRLEELWNDLQARLDFSLLCAYPIDRLPGEVFGRLVGDVCAAHSRVVPAESFAALAGEPERARVVAELQQKAATLEAEIAQRMRAERELRDFVESAAIPMHWVARDGTVLWANRAELDMLGYTYEEYVGQHVARFHADQAVVDDMLERLSRGETLREYPAQMRCKDGSLRDVLVDSTVLWDEDRFVHTRCFARDVTELRRLEAERERFLLAERAARRAAEEQAAAHVSLNAALREVAEERDRVLAAERAARAQVEAAQRRSTFLAAASAALAASLDYGRTLDQVARLVVGEVADWCVVDLAEPDGFGGRRLRRVAAAHADPAKAVLADRLRASYPSLDGSTSHTALRVVHTGQTFFDPAVSEERLAAEARDEAHLALLRELGFRAEIVVPLVAHGQPLGAMTLVAAGDRAYGPEDVALAEELAHRCALAVANAQAFAAEEVARLGAQRAAARTRRLQEITGHLSRSLEPDRVLESVASAAAELLDAPVGAVFLLDPARPDGDFALVAAHGIDPARSSGLRLPRHASLAGRALDERRTLVADDVRQMPGTALPLLLTGVAAGSEIAAPIAAGDEPLGAVKAFSPTVRRFSRDDVEILSTLAAAAAVALANARLYRQAQDAIRTRDEFLSTAAHDLKSPLTTIKGVAQLLKRQLTRGQADEARLLDGLGNLDAAATRMSRQVDQLLDITRLRIGQQLELRLGRVDLVALAEQVAAEHRQAERTHEIRVEHEGAPLVGWWDRARIERVIDNLVSNAVKYSREGSDVLLRLGLCREDNRGWAVLEVEDHGIGIPAAELGGIFDRFRRASNVPEPVGGSGIGLSSVRQMVEAHGGTVGVRSEEGVGSTFTVRLPLEEPAA